MALAALLYHVGKRDQAEALYREVLDSEPNNPDALNGVAWALVEIHKDFKAALPLAEKAVALAPDDPHVLDTRGVILSNLPGRLPDARKDFLKCVELTAPDSGPRAKALFRLGRVCAKLNDAGSARKYLNEAVRIDRKVRALSDRQRREAAEILESLPAKP